MNIGMMNEKLMFKPAMIKLFFLRLKISKIQFIILTGIAIAAWLYLLYSYWVKEKNELLVYLLLVPLFMWFGTNKQRRLINTIETNCITGIEIININSVKFYFLNAPPTDILKKIDIIFIKRPVWSGAVFFRTDVLFLDYPGMYRMLVHKGRRVFVLPGCFEDEVAVENFINELPSPEPTYSRLGSSI